MGYMVSRSSTSAYGYTRSKSNLARFGLGCLAVLLTVGALQAPLAQAAAPAPAWSIQSLAEPTNFSPGAEGGLDNYQLFVTNSGAEASDGTPVVISDTLPRELGVESVALDAPGSSDSEEPGWCETVVAAQVSTVRCRLEGVAATLLPGQQLQIRIGLRVPLSALGPLVNRVVVEGGGALETASLDFQNQAGGGEAHSGFEEFHTGLTGPDGRPVNQSGSLPYQYTTTFAINTELSPVGSSARFRPAGGDPKQIEVTLPPGLVGNPTGTKLCTAQRFNTLHASPGERS
jgi:hypothetical protein